MISGPTCKDLGSYHSHPDIKSSGKTEYQQLFLDTLGN